MYACRTSIYGKRWFRMKKIIVADPTKENRKRLIRALNPELFSFQEIAKGRDWIETVPEDVVLVVASQELADMSALEALEQVYRENPYFSEIPCVVCASDNTESFFSRAIARGFKLVIHKPYNRRTLFGQIKKLLVDEKQLDESYFSGAEETLITEREKIDYLKYLLSQDIRTLNPKHNSNVDVGYYYPQLTDFFAIAPGEGFDILESFMTDNVFKRNLVDKVNLCPKCSNYQINFREVCPQCKSLHIHQEEVLHHFACGYVGPASDFKGMKCPKCGEQLRHIGLDYEKPTETFVCQDCSYIFTESKVEFNCFNCDYVGDAEKVIITKIYSYTLTPKAVKAVEFNSLTTFEFKHVIKMDRLNCFNMDFFNFLFSREYAEAKDYGDNLALIVIALLPSKRTQMIREELVNYIPTLGTAYEAVTSPSDNNIAILVTRKKLEEIESACDTLRKFINERTAISAKENEIDKTSVMRYDFGIFIRFFKFDGPHTPNDFLQTTLDIVNQRELNRKVQVIDE